MVSNKSYSFTKDFRLRSKSDFYYLKNKSNKISTNNLIIYYKNSKSNLGHARIGLAISTKVGKANIRNKFKRIIRSIFRQDELKYFNIDLLLVVSNKILKNYSLKNAIHFLKKDLISARNEISKNI